MTREPKPRPRTTRAYRNIGRITEIIAVLVKFGFGDLAVDLGLHKVVNRVRRMAGFHDTDQASSRPRRLRLAMEELGLVFIKLGQYLSTRRDFMPPSYVEELSRLQDRVPPMPEAEVRRILADSLGERPFLRLEGDPLASASVGQVHAAALPDGTEVAVKIRRPGLERKVSADLDILALLALQAERRLPGLARVARPTEAAAEFSRTLLHELDFRAEAASLQRFSRLYAGRPDVKIPSLVPALCTEDTIVMELLSGVRLDDPEGLSRAGIDRKALARLTARTALEQIMLFGFFHADPHPGNLYARPGPVVAFMDFGLTGQLPRATRDELLRLARGAVRNDPRACARSVLKIAGNPARADRDRLELDLSALLENHLTKTLKEINLNACMRDVIDIMHQHRLRIPPDLLLLVKALVQFENLGAGLDDGFNILDEARPLVTAIYRERYSPDRFLRDLAGHADDALRSVMALPKDLEPFIDMLKRGRIRTETRIRNLDSLEGSIRKAAATLSAALVLSALLLGSALIFTANESPHWRGLPLAGLLCLGAAAVAGIVLLIIYLRRKGPP
jgi:ubiquinone biosynthesis protein